MTPTQLKKIRRKIGLSQFALAEKSKINRYRINHFECGYLKLTEEEIEKINQAIEGASPNGNSDTQSQPQ